MKHSEHYQKVKHYYENYIKGELPQWSLYRVRAAVGKWITAEEYEEITGEMWNDEGV